MESGAATGPALEDGDDDDAVAISKMIVDGAALDGVALAPTLGVSVVGAFARLASDLVATVNAEEARACG